MKKVPVKHGRRSIIPVVIQLIAVYKRPQANTHSAAVSGLL